LAHRTRRCLGERKIRSNLATSNGGAAMPKPPYPLSQGRRVHSGDVSSWDSRRERASPRGEGEKTKVKDWGQRGVFNKTRDYKRKGSNDHLRPGPHCYSKARLLGGAGSLVFLSCGDGSANRGPFSPREGHSGGSAFPSLCVHDRWMGFSTLTQTSGLCRFSWWAGWLVDDLRIGLKSRTSCGPNMGRMGARGRLQGRR